MKKYITLIILSAIAMICIPALMVKKTSAPTATTAPTTTDTTMPVATTQAQGETISVFRTAQNKSVEMDMFEYVCGSVAAEMPLAYNTEAIKAQAVACYTNALRQKASTADGEAHISDDIKLHQGYIDEAQRREKWGADFDKYEEKLKNSVLQVQGQAMFYGDGLCVAAFHAVSCGKTESSQNIWGSSIPYLVSRESPGDTTNNTYATTVSYNTEGFNKCLKTLSKDEKDVTSAKDMIKITKTSPSGTVLQATVNGKAYTGEQIRTAFSLRSPVFTVKTTDDTVTFSVKGYGHGVGMSQYGANCFANDGYTYDRILKHYYTGIEIKTVDT